ncbi:DHHC zinc finger membrane protein [Aspergillus luchuensis]|uniref:DHHC zinc finger membrane protein n=1 Tax=Aspergillus kawachii TaxID=1069201 RepID=A0A146FWM5_ASPKA|nr:DHHC zinc finger membrane protein [Aspergillus luchuensis]
MAGNGNIVPGGQDARSTGALYFKASDPACGPAFAPMKKTKYHPPLRAPSRSPTKQRRHQHKRSAMERHEHV